jgi:hypothetical protein
MLYKFNKSTLEFENVNFQVISSILVLITFILIFSNVILSSRIKNSQLEDLKHTTEETKLIILNEYHSFSPEKLKEYIISLNLKFPHIVYAQAQLESGNFSSKLFKENNNLFGMKVARVRPTTNSGERLGHAYFQTWRESVVDYAFYQASYLKNITSEEQYLSYLSENYAEDPNYVNKLKNIIGL